MVYFSADWCISCKVNKAVAIETDKVAMFIKEHNIVPMLADFTHGSPIVKSELRKLGCNSIPVLAIYPVGHKPIIMPDLLTEQQVLSALRQAVELSKGK